jgi:hypothetical protein
MLDVRLRNGRTLQEAVIVTLDAQARVAELRGFVRPLPGLVAFMAEMAPRVAGRRSRAHGAMSRASLPAFAALTRGIDWVGARVARSTKRRG